MVGTSYRVHYVLWCECDDMRVKWMKSLCFFASTDDCLVSPLSSWASHSEFMCIGWKLALLAVVYTCIGILHIMYSNVQNVNAYTRNTHTNILTGKMVRAHWRLHGMSFNDGKKEREKKEERRKNMIFFVRLLFRFWFSAVIVFCSAMLVQARAIL